MRSQLSRSSLSNDQVSCSYFMEEYGNVYTKNYKKMCRCILNICPVSERKSSRQPRLDPVFLSIYRFYGNTTFYCISRWIYVLIFCDKKELSILTVLFLFMLFCFLRIQIRFIFRFIFFLFNRIVFWSGFFFFSNYFSQMAILGITKSKNHHENGIQK